MLSIKIITIIFIFTTCVLPIFSQEIGFMGINIGMSRTDVLNFTDEQNLIEVPKNRDVEFFPVEDRKILALSIMPEVPHIYLQFYNEILYAITVVFNDKYIDYYTLNGTLQEKYGEYQSLRPDWRKWVIGDVEIKAEKPAVVKYIALKEFLEVTGIEEQNGLQEEERKRVLLEGL
jgi:hypothetical protein